ncbi:MAG: recombinase zinc beta ribbon domain-containing protein [Ruminococcus sp.]
MENDHEAIIEREIWDAAQLEINRIKEFKRNHQIRELGSSSLEPFYGKIFCGCCGGRMVKKSRKSVWRCINSGKEKGGFCEAKPVEGHKMEEYVAMPGHSWYPREKIFCQAGRKILPRKCPGALTCSTDERTDRKVSCLVPGGEEDENGDRGNYNWG